MVKRAFTFSSAETHNTRGKMCLAAGCWLRASWESPFYSYVLGPNCKILIACVLIQLTSQPTYYMNGLYCLLYVMWHLHLASRRLNYQPGSQQPAASPQQPATSSSMTMDEESRRGSITGTGSLGLFDSILVSASHARTARLCSAGRILTETG